MKVRCVCTWMCVCVCVCKYSSVCAGEMLTKCVGEWLLVFKGHRKTVHQSRVCLCVCVCMHACVWVCVGACEHSSVHSGEPLADSSSEEPTQYHAAGGVKFGLLRRKTTSSQRAQRDQMPD